MNRKAGPAASSKLSSAIIRGEIVRSNECELCGWNDELAAELDKRMAKEYKWKFVSKDKRLANIVGHHWRGYDYPLDVWWVCRGCNSWLPHDGILSKHEAKQRAKRRKNSRWFLLLSLRVPRKVIDISCYSEAAQKYMKLALEPVDDPK